MVSGLRRGAYEAVTSRAAHKLRVAPKFIDGDVVAIACLRHQTERPAQHLLHVPDAGPIWPSSARSRSWLGSEPGSHLD